MHPTVQVRSRVPEAHAIASDVVAANAARRCCRRRCRRLGVACSSTPPQQSVAPVSCYLEPLARRFEFPHRGSGLLWARSTGLKLWPGAMLLSRAIAEDHGKLLASLFGDGGGDGSGGDGQSSAPDPPWHGWRDAAVLELGCGLGLVSSTAAWLGARVVATDGDGDLLRVSRRNIEHNTRAGGGGAPLTRHAPAVAPLLWGDEQALRAALAKLPPATGDGGGTIGGSGNGSESSDAAAGGDSSLPALDAVLMSDCVYGSDPSVWEKLVATLEAATAGAPGTLVFQSETPRVEGKLYYEASRRLHDDRKRRSAPSDSHPPMPPTHNNPPPPPPPTKKTTTNNQRRRRQYWDLLAERGFDRAELPADDRRRLVAELERSSGGAWPPSSSASEGGATRPEVMVWALRRRRRR